MKVSPHIVWFVGLVTIAIFVVNMIPTQLGSLDDKKKEEPKEEKKKETFLDSGMFNAPVINGFRPSWFSGPSPPSYLSPTPPFLPGSVPIALMGKLASGGLPAFGVGNGVYPPMGLNYEYPQISYQNALDRVYNPLRYPERSEAFYEQGWYPNMILPPQVIGCGGRRGGCLGGTQEGIPVLEPPIEISERNIAPINIFTKGPLGVPQQVGVLYKIFGSLNDVLPLYGRKKFANSDTWDYYTMGGPDGGKVKLRVFPGKNTNNELGTNDEVRVEGTSAKYRVSIYPPDSPMYIPYA